jgi:hypothetical protein
MKFPINSLAPGHEGMVSGGKGSQLLTSELDGRECPPHAPSATTPEGETVVTHCIGSWVGLRVGLDAVKYVRCI